MPHTQNILASSVLEAFLSHGIDRCGFISDWLRAKKIPHTVVEMAGRRHIVVNYSADAYDPAFRTKTLVAQYDRAPGTPGANDNSAACFQLMMLADRLQKPWSSRRVEGETAHAAHNVRIIFTDGEEAAGTNGIVGQGSFALGEGLRKLGMTGDDVFVFDACGRGDTIVLSTSGHERKTGPALAGKLADLHDRASDCAAGAVPDSWVTLPTPYSDNAGFLAAGIAAQVLTVLPRQEANALLRAIAEARDSGNEKELADAIIAHGRSPVDAAIRAAIPETWRLMHTEKDNAASLTASAFRLMETLLDHIARERDPVR
jgi:hypothetical protein